MKHISEKAIKEMSQHELFTLASDINYYIKSNQQRKQGDRVKQLKQDLKLVNKYQV